MLRLYQFPISHFCEKVRWTLDYKSIDHKENKFLAGDQFTRADLAAASLLAPLCMPVKHGLVWPDKIPDKLQKLTAEFQQRIAWVDEIYEKYR